ncbi:MAG: hypothetical protein Q8942_04570 [Bacillota bacterium]|nr:hypothetical protein [Bacillota bacterium]
MKNKKVMLTILASLLFTSLIGCQAPRPNPVPSPAPSPVPSTQSYNIKPQNLAENVQKVVPVPTQLGVIRTNAEGIFADSANQDWKKVASRMNLIKTSFNDLKSTRYNNATSASTKIMNGLGTAINNLNKQINAKKVYETRFDANQLIKYLPEAYNLAQPSATSDFIRLGYLGREIDLNVEKSQWLNAKSNFNSAINIWSKLKGKISSSFSTDVNNFNTTMTDLERSIGSKSATDARNYAKLMLDRLGILENDMTKQSGSK